MFKEIGIFVKENSVQSTKNSALDSMISCILDCDSNLYIDESSDYKNDNVKALSHKDLVEKVDLIIVFGGDGTLLNSARQYLDSQIPILGVNMGNVGFLTDLSVDNFETTIAEILSGNYKIEERNLVSAQFDDNHLYGLNEVGYSFRRIRSVNEIQIKCKQQSCI
jgi:NAD+ kinase